MIISFVLGGLGNQCFQYAVGRHLASIQDVPLKLETFGYNFAKYAHHPFHLDKFNTKAHRARPVDYLKVGGQAFRRRVFIFERSPSFDESILRIKQHAVLVGYWQSVKYFAAIASLIREELTLKEPPTAPTRDMAVRIRGCDAVAVHVRRKDYVANPKNVRIFEECSLDYYRDAMSLIAQSVKSPHFFIFSDDHAWTRAHLRSDFPLTFVTHNDQTRGHEDLMLMRSCKHNIIANSTFSWWGAWLNDHPRKIVIAPRRWYRDDRRNNGDLLPKEWIQL